MPTKGAKELLILELEAKEKQFELNAKHGIKDWALLDEINDIKKELESLEDTCNLDGECLSCGS